MGIYRLPNGIVMGVKERRASSSMECADHSQSYGAVGATGF